jgi:S-adenosylmethionine synthetase
MKNELDNFKISVSEQVSPGHPDKICDQIADSILDNCLKQDKNSRTAIEVLISNNNIFITGEINSKAEINYQKIIKNVLKKTSYSKSLSGVDQNNFNLFLTLQEQSKDIRKSIFKNDEIGSGDQSTVIGYATSENDAYLP